MSVVWLGLASKFFFSARKVVFDYFSFFISYFVHIFKFLNTFIVIIVQLLSSVWLFGTPWIAALLASLSFFISRSLLKFMSIELVMPSSHLILCHPLLFLPSIFRSIKVFSNELALHIRWPDYWSFSFSISPSNEYSVLISFRIDWFDHLAVKGTLKNHLEDRSSKAPVLQRLAFIMVHLSYLTWLLEKS